MTHDTLFSFIAKQKEEIDKRLPFIVESIQAPSLLKEAMLYSLKAGGKRLRPMLLLATLEGYKKPISVGYEVASVIEMIHTYSLIHDDLPSMDNDDLRRGKPTNHKVFGDAVATLAGDGLLTYSFQYLSSLDSIPNEIKIELIHFISKAAGPSGMVGGQVEDILGEKKALSVEELEEIHHRKTGDLLAVSVESGAILAGINNESERSSLHLFAKHLGLAFQIKDDILDIEGDEQLLGKPVGSDLENDKSTYPKLLGIEGAKEKLSFHIEKAKKYLYETTMDHTLLLELTNYIHTRTK
ncbi:polyprenyl synthetase family protein [Evansella sp. AB-P1]|uniref:polyprenyl synthetase family protein n=1 Tax=Evansella sp. AB-P1 TaxID=3037653 RepID=UPI00241C6FCC|nr:farnesyl diphosphate synthase [Evansella sp. AB-P1]MDG5788686.1 polyprenyl synthetase family protein [Evansella sp. AB-P1]